MRNYHFTFFCNPVFFNNSENVVSYVSISICFWTFIRFFKFSTERPQIILFLLFKCLFFLQFKFTYGVFMEVLTLSKNNKL